MQEDARTLMPTPDKWVWYKCLHKICAIKIHNSCFNNTKRYKIGWGSCTGWYLNDTITAYSTALWKVPIWVIYFSLWLYIKAAKVFILMCIIQVAKSRD
jgi:hypothetical protein